MTVFDGRQRKRKYSAPGLPYHVRVQRFNEEKHELLYNSAGCSVLDYEKKIKDLAKKWRV